MLLKIHKFARYLLDIFIIFVCLIGAGEVKSYACISDDEYENAIHEFGRAQEVRCNELENSYSSLNTKNKDQSTQTEEAPSLLPSVPRSFFNAMRGIPDQKFVLFYCSFATILTVDGLLSIRMAAYLHDLPLFNMGVFELTSGASLLGIPFLAFNLSISNTTSKKACAFLGFCCIVSFMNWMGGRAV